MKNILPNKLFFLILLWLPIYQDSHLYLSIGTYGHAPIAIFSLIAFAYCLLTKNINKTPIINYFIKMIFIMIFVSMINILIYLLNNGTLQYLNENLLIKTIKGSMYFVSITCYIISYISLGKRYEKNYILRQYKNIFLFLFIIMIIEYFTIPSAFSFLHAIRPYNYYRIRLLTSESSWTTTIIIVYFSLALAYALTNKKRILTFFIILMGIIFFLTTTSKSLLVCGLLLVLFLTFSKSQKITYKKFFIIIIMIIVMSFFSSQYYNKVLELFSTDINNSTSISTRLYTIFCGLTSIIKNPLGYGTGTYLPQLTSSFENNLDIFMNLQWFNPTEILNLIKSNSDSSLSIKSGLIQYTLYWGIIGSFYFITMLIKVFKLTKTLDISKNEENIYRACLTILAIFITFVSSFDYKYEIWSFISYLILLKTKKDSKKRSDYNDKINSNVSSTVS